MVFDKTKNMSDIHTGYRPLPLFITLFVSCIIFASWLLPTTAEIWDSIDRQWFYTANGSLKEGESWQLFWAIANYRAFDLIPGSILLLLFFTSAWKDHSQQLPQRIAIGMFMAIYCVITIQLTHLLTPEERMGPSLVLKPAYMLTELVPSINAKDYSGNSFPGDHAAVMGLISLFICYFCGKRYGIAAITTTLLFSIPRTVGGAHWLSDIIISLTVIVPIAAALAIYTPLAGYMITHIQRMATPFLQRFCPYLFIKKP